MHCFMTYSELVDDNIFNQTVQIAERCSSDIEHSLQIIRLSLSLLDGLREVIPFQHTKTDLLIYASILHDIGWIGGRKGHHKKSMELILDNPTENLTEREIMMTALIARYHRKTLPNPDHFGFNQLSENDRLTVSYMAALLRISDGLDKNHDSTVQIVECRIDSESICISIKSELLQDPNIESGLKKADLLELLTKRKVIILQVN